MASKRAPLRAGPTLIRSMHDVEHRTALVLVEVGPALGDRTRVLQPRSPVRLADLPAQRVEALREAPVGRPQHDQSTGVVGELLTEAALLPLDLGDLGAQRPGRVVIGGSEVQALQPGEHEFDDSLLRRLVDDDAAAAPTDAVGRQPKRCRSALRRGYSRSPHRPQARSPVSRYLRGPPICRLGWSRSASSACVLSQVGMSTIASQVAGPMTRPRCCRRAA